MLLNNNNNNNSKKKTNLFNTKKNKLKLNILL